MSLRVASLAQQRALLVILLATSERSLEAFQAADNPIDTGFVADLERIITRSRAELVQLDKKIAEAAS
jgi:hypothetical protein